MAEQMQRRSLRYAILASLPLVLVALLLVTLWPEEPARVGADTPTNPEAVSRTFTFKNNTPSQASDLHVTFNSAIDKASVTTQPPECDGANREITSGDNFVEVFWSIKCIGGVGIGGSIQINVFSKDPQDSARLSDVDDLRHATPDDHPDEHGDRNRLPKRNGDAERDSVSEHHPLAQRVGYTDHADGDDTSHEHAGDTHQHSGGADEHLHEHAATCEHTGHADAAEDLR